jgi:hypothetical protein
MAATSRDVIHEKWKMCVSTGMVEEGWGPGPWAGLVQRDWRSGPWVELAGLILVLCWTAIFRSDS